LRGLPLNRFPFFYYLKKLNQLKPLNQDVVMDILRGLQSPSVEIQRKTIELTLSLLTPRTVNEVMLSLKKEVIRASGVSSERAAEHRQVGQDLF
jgi:coatomer subunit beta